MSDAEKPTPSAEEKAVEAEIAARLTEFNRHKKELLDPLRKVYERAKTEPFDVTMRGEISNLMPAYIFGERRS